MSVSAVEAAVVAIATLGLIVTRPRGLNEGLAALAGGALTLILGLVPWHEAVQVEAGSWNIFLFFLGMMAIAALADQSGIFDAMGRMLAALARGRVRVLYAGVLILGTIISLLFANDSTALVLTPIVYALVLRLSLDPIPFVFATTFIADTGSIGLPVSNPLNVIVVDRFRIGLVPYVSHLWLAALLPIVVNAGVFFLLYRRQLRGRFRLPVETPTAGPGLASTAAGLLLVAVAYLVASALELPLGVVAVAGGALLALNLRRVGMLRLDRLRREMSWPIFGFIAGMLLVVQSLHNTDITGRLGTLLVAAGHGSAGAAIASSTVGAALGSNLINNLPMAMVMTRTIPEIHAGAAVHQSLVYGTIAGCDLGPNLTHLGSLATFIWLFFLRRKGLDVSAWDYLRVGVLVTPLLLAAAIAGIWLVGEV